MQKNTCQNNISRKDVGRRSEDEKLEQQRLDQELDRQLEGTFPASDALKITLRHSGRPTKLRRRVRAEY